MKACLYCQRDDHHLCVGPRRCGCRHSLADQVRSSKKYHQPEANQ